MLRPGPKIQATGVMSRTGEADYSAAKTTVIEQTARVSMRFRVFSLGLVIFIVQGVANAAQDDTRVLPGRLGTERARQPWPYSAVARIDVRSRGRTGECTGTLIGRRLVVTAAHCVVVSPGRTARSIRVTFELGQETRSWTVDFVSVAPGFRHVASWRMVARDWALLTLAGGPGVAPVPVSHLAADELERASRMGEVVRAGYGAGSRGVLSIHHGCALQGVPSEPDLVLHECYSSPGNSGSPLLLIQGQAIELAALHAAVGRHAWRDPRDRQIRAMWVGGGPAARALAPRTKLNLGRGIAPASEKAVVLLRPVKLAD
jgi:protease YdgD